MSIATKCTCGSAINGVCNFSNGCPQLVPPPGRPKGGMPPLAEPALNDEDVNDWEMMKRKEGLKISDYEEVLADHRRLVRELDIIINGDNAATQAALGDVVRQIRDLWPKRQTGAVWVKASEFKTTAPVYRPYRRKREDGEYDYGEIYVTEDEGEIFLDIDNENTYEPQSFEKWQDYDILYEPKPTPQWTLSNSPT